jgi:flagellar protein FliO/FliZ
MSDPTLFAAPNAAAHAGSTGGAFEVTLALLLVVGIIAALAWFARRARGGLFRGRNARIQVLATQPLGVKESAVLVRVGDTDILVGVSQGSVRPLHVFPAGANTEAPPAPEPDPNAPKAPNFRDMLMRSLGKSEQGK